MLIIKKAAGHPAAFYVCGKILLQLLAEFHLLAHGAEYLKEAEITDNSFDAPYSIKEKCVGEIIDNNNC